MRQVQYSQLRQTMATITLAAGKLLSLLMAGNDDEMYHGLNVTPKTTEQHLIVHSGKSEA